MSILSGYKKFKKYLKTTDGYQLISYFTSSDTVNMVDENGNITDTTLTESINQVGKGRELTQAEYDALSEEEKRNGTVYYITDDEGVVLESARSIAFDNTGTNLSATNVQGAIEEIENNVTEINNNSIPKELSITGEHVHSAAHAYQIGHEVIANIYFNNLTLTANTFFEIGAIEVAPLKASNFVCVFIDVSNNKVLGYGNLKINTSGILSIKSDIDITQGRCAANVVYVCK